MEFKLKEELQPRVGDVLVLNNGEVRLIVESGLFKKSVTLVSLGGDTSPGTKTLSDYPSIEELLFGISVRRVIRHEDITFVENKAD